MEKPAATYGKGDELIARPPDLSNSIIQDQGQVYR